MPRCLVVLTICVAAVMPVTTTYAGDLYVPGGYLTIQAAVDAAGAGDTIHVGAGIYAEIVNITAGGITLCGAGDSTVVRGAIGVSGTGANEVVLQQLQVVGVNSNAISVWPGAARIEGVNVSGGDQNGITFSDSSVSMTGCTIAANGYHGVRGYGSSITMADCTLTGNGVSGEGWMSGCGARLSDCSSVTLQTCTMNGNAWAGAYIIGCASATATDCRINNNSDAGLRVDGTGTTTTLNTCTFDSNEIGLAVFQGAYAEATDCQFDGGSYGAVLWGGGATGDFARCTATGCASRGFFLNGADTSGKFIECGASESEVAGFDFSGGTGKATTCNSHDNVVGFHVRQGSPAQLTNCVANQNRDHGILGEGSPITMVGCTLSNNGVPGLDWGVGCGVRLSNCSTVTLDTCTASDNVWAGVYITECAPVTVTDCTFRGAQVCGCRYEGTNCAVTMQGGAVSDTLDAGGTGGIGVAYLWGCGGTLREVEVSNNGVGVNVLGSDVVVDSNTIHDNASHGISVRPWPGGMAHGVWQLNPDWADEDIQGQPTITGNTITGNDRHGIECIGSEPTNVDTLAADNVFSEVAPNGESRVYVGWLGLVKAVHGDTPVEGAAVEAVDAEGVTAYTGTTNAGGCAPASASYNNAYTWALMDEFYVDSSGAMHMCNPHTVTAASSDGSLRGTAAYSWDGNPKPEGSDIDGRYQIAIVELKPWVEADGPFTVTEGSSVVLTAQGSDPDADEFTYAWDLDNDGSFETLGQSVTFSAAELDGPSSHTVGVEVTDSAGLTATHEAAVEVANAAPAVGVISAPLDPVQVNTTVNVSAEFTDPGVPDTHTAQWQWGDETASSGDVAQASGSGSVAGEHTYAEPGVYTITFTVTDDDGDAGDSSFQYVVVYDPDDGFVTGGGWIMSPEGAYAPDASLTGKASFGFNAKYKKGANVPTGQTQFQFKVADLNFHSTEYQWLVIAGARAKYKGFGTINGDGDYGFMLTAIDGQINGGGGEDKFRIKIWDKASEDIVYDNQMGAADDGDDATIIGGGNIVIHKSKVASTQVSGVTMTGASALATARGAEVVFTLSADANVSAEVLNIAGRLVGRVCTDRASTAGVNVLLWDGRSATGTRVPAGRYLVRVMARSEDGAQTQSLVPLMK